MYPHISHNLTLLWRKECRSRLPHVVDAPDLDGSIVGAAKELVGAGLENDARYGGAMSGEGMHASVLSGVKEMDMVIATSHS